ncbi:hypothetical protein WN51_12954 [Melipona quadrifasciata]|uniref:Uncharacterized protein n=1 Tax=Melipona quadrifasciata TaxID=166423 RepID=A0A0N0U7E9_9HYME|nr:hypothetical protein WN51_12954 [Melipona quadrifasciata]
MIRLHAALKTEQKLCFLQQLTFSIPDDEARLSQKIQQGDRVASGIIYELLGDRKRRFEKGVLARAAIKLFARGVGFQTNLALVFFSEDGGEDRETLCNCEAHQIWYTQSFSIFGFKKSRKSPSHFKSHWTTRLETVKILESRWDLLLNSKQLKVASVRCHLGIDMDGTSVDRRSVARAARMMVVAWVEGSDSVTEDKLRVLKSTKPSQFSKILEEMTN